MESMKPLMCLVLLNQIFVDQKDLVEMNRGMSFADSVDP